MKTNPIGWCDETFNPFIGCSKCSPGCENCYAERFAARLAQNPKTAPAYRHVIDANGHWNGRVYGKWAKWPSSTARKGKRIFVGSMCDIFHEDIEFSTLAKMFSVLSFCQKHTFFFLTKRPERMHAFFTKFDTERFYKARQEAARVLSFGSVESMCWPPTNFWLGVTVCNQQEGISKIPLLLDTPAAKRFLSVEPMLGPVDLTRFLPALDWVICGGETGSDARPMHSDWVRLLRASCLVAGVPFYFKGWGEWLPCSEVPDDMDVSRYPIGDIGDDGIFIPPPALEIPIQNGVCHEDTVRVGKEKSGHLIDGREWREFPAQERETDARTERKREFLEARSGEVSL